MNRHTLPARQVLLILGPEVGERVEDLGLKVDSEPRCVGRTTPRRMTRMALRS